MSNRVNLVAFFYTYKADHKMRNQLQHEVQAVMTLFVVTTETLQVCVGIINIDKLLRLYNSSDIKNTFTVGWIDYLSHRSQLRWARL